jgi:Glutamine amidotransferase class-I
MQLQNHNYAVDPTSLPEGAEVTHVNLNDNSCAGLAFPKLKLMSLQYHPESSSPGPHDSDLGTQFSLLNNIIIFTPTNSHFSYFVVCMSSFWRVCGAHEDQESVISVWCY